MEENNEEMVQNDVPVQEPLNEVQEEKVEQKFTPMGQVNEERPKKKKSKAGLVVVVILLLLAAIIGGLAYYYLQIYTNPKVVYQKILETGFNTLTESLDEEEITTVKAKTKLDVDIDLDEIYTMEDGVDELLDLINKTDVEVELQMDTNEKQAIFKIASNYENEELLNADMLFDAKNEETYLKLEEFFDDILEIEMEDEYYEELDSSLGIEKLTIGQKINSAKAKRILKRECKNIIKEEYCSKEKEKITIDSKEINADKYILKMTYSQYMNELIAVFENLKNNEEFLKCFKDQQEQKESYEDIIENLKELEIDDVEATIYLKLYRTGLKQEFVRVDFEVEAEGEKLILEVEKVEDKYEFELSYDDETYFSGAIALEELDNEMTKMNLKLESDGIGTIALNMEYGYTINEAIDKIDVKNAVKMENLTEDDMLKAYENLQESKLYTLVEKFSTLSGNAGSGEDSNINTQIPNDENRTMNEFEKNITVSGESVQGANFIAFAKNNNIVAVDMDIEVEYYDANGGFVGSEQDTLTGIGAGREIAVDMWKVPANAATYKIYVEAEKSNVIEFLDKIEVTDNNNGENIAVQVKNNSTDTIEYITVSVVYYNAGKVVGIEDGIASDVKAGRSGNFNIYFPVDADYNDVQFDKYKVYVKEAYSYNW